MHAVRNQPERRFRQHPERGLPRLRSPRRSAGRRRAGPRVEARQTAGRRRCLAVVAPVKASIRPPHGAGTRHPGSAALLRATMGSPAQTGQARRPRRAISTPGRAAESAKVIAPNAGGIPPGRRSDRRRLGRSKPPIEIAEEIRTNVDFTQPKMLKKSADGHAIEFSETGEPRRQPLIRHGRRRNRQPRP